MSGDSTPRAAGLTRGIGIRLPHGSFPNFHCFTKYVKVAFFRGAAALR